jgi:D-psicose/D-tagatose/L-ribulose 3-epimerase
MKFGAHAFVWEGEWNSETAQRVIEGAAGAGLDFVEIPLLRPETYDAAETRRMLEANGLYATFSLGLPAQASLPEHPKEAERFLKDVLEKVDKTGSETLTGVIYGTLGELPGRRPTEEDFAVIAGVLKEVAREARIRGMRIGIEPVNRYETFLVNTAAQAVSLLDRIGEENVFVHLDTYHLNIEEESYGDAIRTAGSRMEYIHLSESHRGTPGTGTVDWDDVFQGLKDIAFPGALTMESFVKLNPDIARATCMWRDIVQDPKELVREGVAFLRFKAQEYNLK